MITYSNISIIENKDFSKYLKLEGYSHSFLKGEQFGIAKDFTVTDKVIVGKLVDGILTEPSTVDMLDKLYPIAKNIAYEIKSKFGDIIKQFKSQISFVCDIEYEGFIMPSKGRLDYLLEGIAVIDLKVTFAKDVKALIEFMKYENQLWHYCKAMNVKTAYLLIYSVPLNKTQLISINVDKPYNDFWAEKTLKFGNVKINQ